MDNQTTKQRTWKDVLPWILIVLLAGIIGYGFFTRNGLRNQIQEYEEQLTYTKITSDNTLSSLKKENKELYDSIKSLKDKNNIESIVEIRYKTTVKTDTIYKESFVQGADSIYRYHQTNDTIDCNIDVAAKDLEWINARFSVRDKFTIINRKDDDTNTTTIDHSPMTEIEGTTILHVKQPWYKHIKHGPQIGVGYGIVNRKFDVFVGYGVSYTF